MKMSFDKNTTESFSKTNMAKKSLSQGAKSHCACIFPDKMQETNEQSLKSDNAAGLTDSDSGEKQRRLEPEASLCLQQEPGQDGGKETPKMPSGQAATLPEPEASVTRSSTPKQETKSTTTEDLQQNFRLCNRVDKIERLLSSMGERVNDLEEKQKRLYKGHSRHCVRTAEGMRKLEEMIAKK